MNPETIAENLAEIRRRLERSAEKAGRNPHEVRLLAVGKTQPVSALLAAYEHGQRLFGENYVQELLAKQDELPQDIEWHHIGQLQGNKAKHVVGRVALVQAVDRAELAIELSRRAQQAKIVQDCLIEVNVGEEASKGGVRNEEALTLAKTVLALPGLRLLGLMSLPPYLPSREDQRPFHRALAALARTLRDETGAPLPVLSMGMSHDFEVAIEEGATLVRVGSALFGPRLARH